jgi:hypothetical protein
MSHLWYEPILTALLSVLVSAFVVYRFGIRQLQIQRRLTFRQRQLDEFYAPLAGIRKQLRAKSELRLKISNATEAAWQDICRTAPRPFTNHEEQFVPFKRIIEHDNEQLKADLVPKYNEMLKLFTERYHLATPETRVFYQGFLEFVEVWNRWLAGSLPAEVWAKLGHTEERVQPFYDHLECQMQELQDEIARG